MFTNIQTGVTKLNGISIVLDEALLIEANDNKTTESAEQDQTPHSPQNQSMVAKGMTRDNLQFLKVNRH